MNQASGVSTDSALEVDLVVLGGGMAGMTAAAWAASQGAQVVIVEKAPGIGGSAALSGGGLWTAADVATLREINPFGDPELCELVVSSWQRVGDWIESTGAEIGPKSVIEADGFSGFPSVSRVFDVLGYLRRCQTIVENSGGVIVTNAKVHGLLTDEGTVVGASVEDREGIAEIHTPHTILATGGFQGDRDLRREFLGEHTADVLIRSSPHNTGDGLRLGRSVGGALTSHLDGWYGHTVPFPLRDGLQPKDYIRFAQFALSPHSLILDNTGQRFVDESAGYYRNAQAVCRQPNQRALLVFDEAARVADTNRRGVADQVDRPHVAKLAGAHVAKADTWEEIESQTEPWGYTGVSEAVKRFNEGIFSVGLIGPERKQHRRPLFAAPFYAMEIQPAITFTHGGLRIDRFARVLDTAGVAIPGLLAAGVDGAGTYHVAYAGGLAMSGGLGIAAAVTATSAAPRP